MRASRTPRCPGPCPAPDVRCPVSSWSPAQSEILVREERSRTSRLLRLQLCANLHSHFVTSPTMPNHVCCSTTRQTRGDQASACSRHKSKKPKSRVCSPLRFCSSIIGLVFSFLFALREGGHAPCEESWLVHASQPQSTHTLPCLVCHSVLIYDTREAPCSSLGGLSGRSLRRTLRMQVVA